jgi:hypothetical protein
VTDAVLGAESLHLADAADRELGSPGIGLVVKAAVENSAVVAALMHADTRLFFEESEVRFRKSLLETKRSRKPDDTAAGDDDAPHSPILAAIPF